MKAYEGIIYTEWELAKGSCGFNLGDMPVFGRYVNGVALFAWGHQCVVAGHMTCGGNTLEDAMKNGVARAVKYGVAESDRRLSRKKFAATLADPTRLSA